MGDIAERGRPSSYRPEMCDKVIEIMSVGGSKIEVCAALDINRDTLYDWCNSESPRFNKEFSDSIKKGEMLFQAWWEQQGRLNLDNSKFNSPLWTKNMSARFKEDWVDTSKQQTQQLDKHGKPADPLPIMQIEFIHGKDKHTNSELISGTVPAEAL